MTRADRILIVLIAVVAIASGPAALAMSSASQGGTVVIDGPAGSSTVSLSSDKTLVVEGLQGEVVVRISGGTARVERADCPDQTCVRTRAAGSRGAAIACIPNGVTIRVGGERDDGLDAVVR